jgi:hypothetical protein
VMRAEMPSTQHSRPGVSLAAAQPARLEVSARR